MRRLLVALLAGCTRGDTDTDVDPVGDGLFAEGCPVGAVARPIGVDATLPGAVAVGTRGDYLLANTRAAFVITAPDRDATYYHYGGIVADAVAMGGCAPLTDDGLDEVGLVLGELNLTDFEQSILRAFRGTIVEVAADGSDGGPAIVRVRGTDAPYWLVDYTLTRAVAEKGGVRPLSPPYGLDLTVDYILDPDSEVLTIAWRFDNPTEAELSVFSAALLSFAPSYEVRAGASGTLDLNRLSLDHGIPFLAASNGRGAIAYTVDQGDLAYTRIAGIDVLLDLQQAISEQIVLPPGGNGVRTTFLAVGPTDGPSAAGPLIAAQPGLVPEQTATRSSVSGNVVDAAGQPVADVAIDVEADGGAGFRVMDIARTDADGRFTAALPDFAPDPWTFRLIARAAGRDPGAAVDVGPGDVDLTVPIGARGDLALDLTESDDPIPARIVLRRGDGLRLDLWSRGDDVQPVPPGDWTYTITRGLEYEVITGDLSVPADGSATLTAALVRSVDTSGWMSIDTHVHTGFSPDSRIEPAAQMLHAAAHGLDVVIHTEHENLADQRGDAEAFGLTGWVTSVIGEEMTATVPEHLTMFPVVPDGSLRGGPIAWYGKDIATLFAEMHARSDGGINLLNHPSYMDLIGWDYVNAVPTLDDPTTIGLAADAELWSWEFEGMELLNGFNSPFASGNSRFEKWQSMLNAGHRVTAVGCSDDHYGDGVGFPRTYVDSPTDDPAAVDVGAIVDAVRGGRAVVSSGAFARVGIDGQGPGSLVTASDTVDLDIHVEAITAIDVTRAVVFANCDQVAVIEALPPDGVVVIDTVVQVDIDGDTQIVVAAFGLDALPDGLPQFDATRVPRVITNAIYVDADGNGVFDAPGGRICRYDE